MEKKPMRCWNTDNPLYIKYHDEEWGTPVHDDETLFEFLVLEGFQAGLTWELILKRRDALSEAFDDFDPEKMAEYTDEDVNRLMGNPAVIRNRAKISAAINNARRFREAKRDLLFRCLHMAVRQGQNHQSCPPGLLKSSVRV
jgi:DNA-3-methyladenine glycosylase I